MMANGDICIRRNTGILPVLVDQASCLIRETAGWEACGDRSSRKHELLSRVSLRKASDNSEYQSLETAHSDRTFSSNSEFLNCG